MALAGNFASLANQRYEIGRIMKRICVFQMHFTDITKDFINYNAVETIVKSNIFDDVVIAAADIHENKCLISWADKWNVDIRFGSSVNVTNRLASIVREYSSQVAIRLLPQWYFIDIKLIRNMIQILEKENADYILLPRDFDIRFGGDVFSNNFINSLDQLFF